MTDLNPLIVAALPRLRAHARRLVYRLQDAEDLLNDTVVIILTKASSFTPGTNFVSWAFTVMTHRHISLGRQRMNRLSREECHALREPAATAPEQESSVAARQGLALLARLEPGQRQMMLLTGAADLTFPEAARVAGCPEGTAKSRASRGRAAAREMWAN